MKGADVKFLYTTTTLAALPLHCCCRSLVVVVVPDALFCTARHRRPSLLLSTRLPGSRK